MSKRVLGFVGFCVLVFYALGCIVTVVYADTLESSSYKFEESFIGGGGLVQSSSQNYQVTESIGDTAVGNTASNNFQTDTGSKTTNDPSLTFTINGGGVNFGSFSPSTATVASSTFSVSNYTSYGYTVQIVGSSFSNGSHTITPLATTGPSQAGVEQFGINLVANTSPSSVGANPDHGQFGFGSAAPNYATSNVYRFVSGETIATAPKSSGVTTYTISYIVNVSSLTPGGQYSANQTLVCTASF
jgi:hypothetical protein